MKQYLYSLVLIFALCNVCVAQERNHFQNTQPDPLLVLSQQSAEKPVLGENAGDKKSVVAAIALSLVLPGTGEWYVGNAQSARYHLLAEGGIWITYASLKLHSQWLKNDAHTFARIHAGASFNGADGDYDVNIGNYMSFEDYNNAKLRYREYDLVYTDANCQWQWDTDANRQVFRSQRIKSSEAANNAKYVIGVAVINRVISAFRAGMLASNYNKSHAAVLHLEILNQPLLGYQPYYSLSITAPL
jgi:hypothetical protein